MNFAFIILGFLYAVSQVILVREFLVVFYGNEIIIGFIFSSWFFWIALGSFLYARFSEKVNGREKLFAGLLFVFPFLVFVQLMGIRAVRIFLSVPASEIVPLGASFCACFILMMPCSFIIGLLFPLGCAVFERYEPGRERLINRVYLYETIGSIMGGMVFTFFFVSRFSHTAVILFLAFLSGIAGWFFSSAVHKKEGYPSFLFLSRLGLVMAALMIISIATPVRTYIERYSSAVRWHSILPDLTFIESVNSRYQYAAIGKRGAQYSIVGDGKFISSFPEEVEHIRFAAVLFAQKPDTRRILLIGGGMDGLLRQLLAYPVSLIDYVEQDPELISLVKPYLPDADRKALEDPRVTVYTQDGRRFVQSLPQSAPYDMVVIRLPDPSSAYINRYYTKEFYQELKRIITCSSIICTGARAEENYFGSDVANYNGSIYHTLKQVFSSVEAAPGSRLLYFAGDNRDAVTADYAVLKKRYGSLPKKYRRFSADWFQSIFPRDRVQFVRKELSRAPHEINLDARPITYYFNMLLWGNFTSSAWLNIVEKIRIGGVWVYIIPLIIVVFVRSLYVSRYPNRGFEQKFNAAYAVFTAGFIAMSLQMVLLFLYQSLFGYIYERIGLVTALFMVGLVFGVLMINLSRSKIHNPGMYIMVNLLCVGVFVMLLTQYVARHTIPEPLFFLLFIISGFLTGCIFPLCVFLFYKSEQAVGATAGIIDSADHAGAMCGALISGSLLVPLLGIEQSCRVLGSMAILGAVPHMQAVFFKKIKKQEEPYYSFPYVKTGWILIIALVSLFGIRSVIMIKSKKSDRVIKDAAHMRSQGSASSPYVEIPFPHYAAYDAKGEREAVSLHTRDVAGDIRGYGGPINIFLNISTDASIREILLLDSQETPAYIAGIGPWLEQFVGRRFPVQRAEIDAMTGATVTAEAVRAIINKSLYRVHTEIFNRTIEDAGQVEKNRLVDVLKNYRLYVMLLLLGLSVWAYYNRGKKLRMIILGFDLIFFGMLLNMLITFVHIGSLTVGALPGGDNILWIVFAVCVALISLGSGQVYCGYICPFGIIQEVCGVFKCTAPPHPFIEKRARYIKYIILAGCLMIFWVSGSAAWIDFSPMNYVFSGRMSFIIKLFCGVIIIGSIFYFRFWCRYFCPTGAFFSFFNKIALFGSGAPAKNYSRCDLGVTDKRDIDCIQCNRCRQTPSEELRDIQKEGGQTLHRIRVSPKEEGGQTLHRISVSPQLYLRDYLFIGMIIVGLIGIGLSVDYHMRASVLNPQERLAAVPELPTQVKRQKPVVIMPRGAREVDYKKLQEALKTGSLSSHEALFYEKLGEHNGK